MKKNFLLFACLLALRANPVKAAAGDPEIVVIRIHEFITSVDMSIIRGPGKTEYLEFKSGSSNKRLEESGQGYYKVLFQLYQEGYVLQSTFTSQVASDDSFTTLVLVKPIKP
jgi:hypothetical protein